MILKIINNSAINSKILLMKRECLSSDDLMRLSHFKSVGEIAEYLKTNSRYSEVLKNTDISSIHRGKLEADLHGQLNRDIKAILPFAGSSAKFFLNLYTIKEEILTLKICLRYLYSENKIPLENTNYFTSKTFEKLKTVKNIEDFLYALSGTHYEISLKSFLDRPEKQNLFEIETALDMYFRKLCHKYIKKYLSGEEEKIVRKTYGTVFDIDTLMFILRSKKYYSFRPQNIYPYISTSNFHLSTAEIRAIVDAKTPEKTLDEINKTKYKKIFSQDTRFFEKPALEYILKVYSSVYRKNQFSIEAILYYIKLKEIEIKNITTLIEGVRYGLDPSVIQSHIIETAY